MGNGHAITGGVVVDATIDCVVAVVQVVVGRVGDYCIVN